MIQAKVEQLQRNIMWHMYNQLIIQSINQPTNHSINISSNQSIILKDIKIVYTLRGQASTDEVHVAQAIKMLFNHAISQL